MALDRIVDLPRFSLTRRKPSVIVLADCARDAGQWELAAQLYREALDRNPRSPPIWVQYGHALKESGRLRDPDKLAQAEAAYRRALSLDPSVADSHLQLGHILKIQGKIHEAKASYLRAFALDPSLPYPLNELSGLGWSEEELSELRGAVRSDDDNLPREAPAHPDRSSSSTGLLIAPPRPTAEWHYKPPHTAFSIASVEADPLLVRHSASEGPRDEPSIGRAEVSPTDMVVPRRAVSAAEPLAQIPFPVQPDLLKAVILAQRWDLDGIKEQLRDAIDENRQLESSLNTRIVALEAELRGVSESHDFSRSLSKTYEAILSRVRQAPLNVICTLADEFRTEPTLLSDMMLVWESALFDETYYREQCAAGEIRGHMPAILHYLRFGKTNRHDPHPLFEGDHYRGQLERGQQPKNLLVHYLTYGGYLSPNPLFCPEYYTKQHPYIRETGINPLTHYVLVGAAVGSDPHSLFDSRYYCSQLEAQGLSRPENPLAHYLSSRSPRISPHWLFDAASYLERHPEVAKAGCAPLVHFLREGDRRDWNPHPLFDTAFYRKQAAERGIESTDLLAHFSEIGGVLGLSPHPLFDSTYYLERSPDVAQSRSNPLQHYLEFGDREGLGDPRRDPHPLFSVGYYKARAGIGADDNALLHYLRDGRFAVDPHPLFDTRYYLSALGNELTSESTPLTYYLTSSKGRQVSPFPLFDQNYYRAHLGDAIHDDGPLLLHYLKQPPEAARSPHPLFDLQFFQETEGRSQPALLAFVSKFWDMATNGYKLASMHYREANRDFCSISYLLDHPDLLNGTEIPLVHYIRGANAGLLWKNGQSLGSARGYSDADTSAFFESAVYVPSRVLDIAREQVRRGTRYLAADDSIFLGGTRRADAALIGLFESCDPRATARGDERKVVGAVARSRRLALYAIYVPDGRLKSYHRAVLAALRNADYVTILVNSTTAGAAALAADAAQLAHAMVVRSGEGRDFASWIIALAHFAPALEYADHTLLLNDSLIGPFGDLRSVLTSLEEDPADFKGLTDSFEREYHLQSSLLMLSRDALFSSAFLKFLLNFVPPTTRHGVVKEGEIGLSMELIRAGVTSSSRIPYSALVETWLHGMTSRIEWAHSLPERLEETGLGRLMRPEVAARFSTFLEDWLFDHTARLRSGVPCNPQHWLWDGLITDGNFPFVKKDLLLINPEHIPTITRLCDIFPRTRQPKFADLLRDLVPPARDLPRPYLHLSAWLVDAIAG